MIISLSSDNQDYFVFSKNYPYELIYPVVVGRWCVDSAVLYLSHHMHHQIVDFSQIVNYHQLKEALDFTESLPRATYKLISQLPKVLDNDVFKDAMKKYGK